MINRIKSTTLALLMAAGFIGPCVAAEDSTKPLVVILYSPTCHAFCEKVRPILQQIKQECPDLEYMEIDASKKENEAVAKSLGKNVHQFFVDFQPTVPYVGFFNGKRKLMTDTNQIRTKEVYLDIINRLLLGKQK